MCGPAIYYEITMRYMADGRWIATTDISETIDLAMAGVQLQTMSGHLIRPRAAFLVNGSALCGPCVSGLGPDAIRKAVLTGHTGRAY